VSEKILIIEDNPEDRYIIGHKLKQEGIIFEEVGTGREGYELLLKGGFTIAFVDLILDDISGFELISMIRSKRELDSLYICVISNIREKEEIEKAVNLGADDYVSKPIDPMILQDKLRVIVKELDARSLPMYSVDTDKSYAKIDMNLPLRIVELNEDQIVFETDYIVNKGGVYDLVGNTISSILGGDLKVKVEDCQQVDTPLGAKYRVVGAIYEMSDSDFGLYRKWLLTNQNKYLDRELSRAQGQES
jgi:CheY-like chemotaxis protein